MLDVQKSCENPRFGDSNSKKKKKSANKSNFPPDYEYLTDHTKNVKIWRFPLSYIFNKIFNSLSQQ